MYAFEWMFYHDYHLASIFNSRKTTSAYAVGKSQLNPINLHFQIVI